MFILITHYFNNQLQILTHNKQPQVLLFDFSEEKESNSKYLQEIKNELLQSCDQKIEKFEKYINLGFENAKIHPFKMGDVNLGILHIKLSTEINDLLNFQDIDYYWNTIEDFNISKSDLEVPIKKILDIIKPNCSLAAHKVIEHEPLKLLNNNNNNYTIIKLKGTLEFNNPTTLEISDKGIIINESLMIEDNVFIETSRDKTIINYKETQIKQIFRY